MIFVESHQKHLSQTKTVHARTLLKWNLPAGFASEILKHPPKTIRKKAHGLKMLKQWFLPMNRFNLFQQHPSTSINIQGAKVVAFVGETFQTYVSAICLGESHVSQRVGGATNPNLVKGTSSCQGNIVSFKSTARRPFCLMLIFIYVYICNIYIHIYYIYISYFYLLTSLGIIRRSGKSGF